jgi:hypothetical protein
MPGDPFDVEALYDDLDAPRKKARDDELMEKSTEWRTTEYGNYNKSIFVGVDLGKKSDYTAIVFLCPFLPINPEEDQTRFVYHISKIDRLPLETPYPIVARLLRKINKQLLKHPHVNYVYYVIDEGGVGTAVADQVIELIPSADIYRVTLTGGLRPKWQDQRNVSLPKPQMASTLIALFESRRLWVAPDLKNTVDELERELMTYERKITAAGHDQFGAMKIGEHDDIASAIGLAAWIAEDLQGGSVPLIW